MANHQRLRRIADQIQRELADLLRHEVKDPRVGMVTITGVEVSVDLAHAKVFFSLLGDADAQAKAEHGLTSAAGFLRSQLGRRLRAHNTPELHFRFDGSIENGMRLSKLIDDANADQGGDAGR
jgi:ribosome-binding factor A